jgi:hypothetical protein
MRLIGLAYGEKAEQTWKQRALRLPSYSAAFAFLILYIEFIRFAPFLFNYHLYTLLLYQIKEIFYLYT